MTSSAARRRRRREWKPVDGDQVELRRWGTLTRHGSVETVLEDYSGFWLRAEGVERRVFVDLNDDDTQVWH